MGFFYNSTKTQTSKPGRRSGNIPVESLNRFGCKVCHLDKVDIISPKLGASGCDQPDIYILGISPTEQDDKRGTHFTGRVGRLLDKCFPDPGIRKGTIVQCYSESGYSNAEFECCRGRVAADIEKSKPKVIVGVGLKVLFWATGLTVKGETDGWKGRRIPVKFGEHVCWFVSLPDIDKALDRGDEYELEFKHTTRKILTEYSRWGTPKVYDNPRELDAGIQMVTGEHAEDDFKNLERALTSFLAAPKIGFDYETVGLRPYARDSRILSCAVSTFDRTVAFAFDHPRAWNSRLFPKVKDLFIDFLLSSGHKIAHNLPFELEQTAYHLGAGIIRRTEWEDTLALAHTLCEIPGTMSLDVLCREYFGFFLKAQNNLDVKILIQVPIPDLLRYNGMDAKWTFKLEQELQARVRKEQDYVAEYERKVRMAPALVHMQLKGVPVDFEYAKMMERSLVNELRGIESKIARCQEVQTYERRFGRFEPTNTNHVLKLLKDVCKREEIQKDGETFTTDEEALSKIPSNEVPSAPLVLEHRAASKALGTYITPIIERKIVYDDGLIHASFNQTIAETGRLSCDDPNLQNFPKRKRVEIRGVVAGDLIAADYGQIEARVIGMASEDKKLVEYLWTGYDIHKAWAIRLNEMYPRVEDWIFREFGQDRDHPDFMKTLRQEIKNKWVFPQFFGAHPRSCARSMYLPDHVAEDLSADFWDEFKGVKRWQDKLIQSYERNLYVETLTGRRRRGALSKNQIINTPIQGTAADVVTEAMTALSLRAELDDLIDLQPNINIHDDLTTIRTEAEQETIIEIMAHEMCKHRFPFIIVPLVVEVSTGPRWHQLEKYRVYESNKLFNISR